MIRAIVQIQRISGTQVRGWFQIFNSDGAPVWSSDEDRSFDIPQVLGQATAESLLASVKQGFVQWVDDNIGPESLITDPEAALSVHDTILISGFQVA